MATDQTFTAFSLLGVPLTGLTPVWATYLDVDTGNPVTAPAFREVGGGVYAFTPNAGVGEHFAGVIDFDTTMASPRYLFWDGGGTDQTFAAFSILGVPLAGLTPTWATYRNVATGNPAPEPTFREVGDGIYAFTPLVVAGQHFVGIVDLGAMASPRYLSWGESLSGDPPSIANLSPAAGQSLRATDALSFDVVAPNGLLRAAITIQFNKMLMREVVHDGFAFGPAYQNSLCTRTVVSANLHRFVIWRSGGWPDSPTLLPLLSDLAGLENT